MNNYMKVSGTLHIITKSLSPYVCENIKDYFGNDWWENGVIRILSNPAVKELPQSGSYQHLVHKLDSLNSLKLINLHWEKIFKFKMDRICRIWINELIIYRNKWAHLGSEDYIESETTRFIDTAKRLLESLNMIDDIEEINILLSTIKDNQNKDKEKLTDKELFLQEWFNLNYLLNQMYIKKIEILNGINLLGEILPFNVRNTDFDFPVSMDSLPTPSHIIKTHNIATNDIIVYKIKPLVLEIMDYISLLDTVKNIVDAALEQLNKFLLNIKNDTTDEDMTFLLGVICSPIVGFAHFFKSFSSLNGNLEILERWSEQKQELMEYISSAKKIQEVNF